MKDKYLVTRFLAIYMYQQNYLKSDDGSAYEYRDDIDDLLGRTMDFMNHMDLDKLEKLFLMVEDTLEKSFFYLGEDAFRLRNDSSRKSPINMNVFETIMYIMTFISVKDKKYEELIWNGVYSFVDSNKFRENISSRRDGYVQWTWRIAAAEEIGRRLKLDTENTN